MRSLIIILIIFVTSGIWSCQTWRQTSVDTTDSSRVTISKVKASMTAEEVLTWLTSSSDIDLSGISIEFYAPDTANPGARASPKSLTIAAAKVGIGSQAGTYKHRTEAGEDTENVESGAWHNTATDTLTEKTALTPPRWIWVLAIIAMTAIVLLSLPKIFRFKG